MMPGVRRAHVLPLYWAWFVPLEKRWANYFCSLTFLVPFSAVQELHAENSHVPAEPQILPER